MTQPTTTSPTTNEPRRVATLSDLVLPPPPNTAPVEWAIAKIKRTLRKRKEPGWSDDEVANFGTAVRLCADREEAIPRGLKRRFESVLDSGASCC